MSLLNCACSKSNLKDNYRDSPPDRFLQPEVRPKEKQREEPLWQQEETGVCMEERERGQGDYPPDCLQYELFSVIGKGHAETATIHLAKHVPSDSLVAVKRVNLEAWDRDLEYLQNELVLTQQLSHNNIMAFHCSFVSDQELWAVMPLMAFGSCRDLIHAYFDSGLPELAILFILRDVVSAVDYIHSKGVIHRSIKGSHVMVSQTGQVKLAGLHTAFNVLQDGRRLRAVHDFPDMPACLNCFSPEMLEQNLGGYTSQSDIYSLGILICELGNGQSPFSDMPPTQMLVEKLSGTKPRLADSTTVGEFVINDESIEDLPGSPQERADDLFFKRTFSTLLHDFSNSCLERDPHDRPTASKLVHHPVFKTIGNKCSSALPALLKPVTPLTTVTPVPLQNTIDEDVSQLMNKISMIDNWTF